VNLGEAQEVISGWASGPPPEPSTRLGAALRGTPASGSQPMSDAAVLIRQVLRTSDESRRSEDTESSSWAAAWLDIPICAAFPANYDWTSFGITVQRQTERASRISAAPWSPAWLPTPHPGGVDAAVAAAAASRADESVAGDPFLPDVDRHIRRYRTPGQKAAVRSALALPPGGTLVVNLPTGAGKTLVMLAAVEWESHGAMSVMVVPTVALAQDHERRYLDQHPDSPPVAYHGSLAPTVKAEFRRRIFNGEQRLVVTNPESLVSSLALPISQAAAGGRLAVLAVDEAHVVTSWGDAFRPQFHALTGLRTHLLRAAREAGHKPFKTLLASATLTQETLQMLRSLFGQPGPFLHVGAPVIRPEPDYWHSINLDEATRTPRLLDALRHLPRPAIVYTTLRQAPVPGTLTPHRISQLLRTHGFRRLATVDGGSTTQQREAALTGLRHSSDSPADLDVVVATSAFGLGIDIPDIRSVIHACLPENLDRYYQEVGRGGRDGRSSTSLVLATNEDRDIARRFAAPKYLTADLARQRWKAMLDASRDAGADLKRLPLTAVPPHLDQNSEYNERWNLLTISLLARVGAVKWDFSFAEYRPEDEYNEGDRGWLTVKIDRGDHLSDSFWSDVVEPHRADVVQRADGGLRNLMLALGGAACTGVITAESYTIADPTSLRTICLAACGGCMWCRTHDRRRWSSPSPTPAAISVPSVELPPLARWSVDGKYGPRVGLVIDPEILGRPRRLRQLLAFLIPVGQIGLIVSPEESLTTVVSALPPTAAQSWPIMVDELGEHDPLLAVGVPTLVLLPGGNEPAPWLDGSSRAPLVVVCADADARVADSAAVFARQDGCYNLSDIEKRL
jgi:ATP-dependent DNA helicase RecQ